MAYNVLIVDDSATMRALIRKILVISGFDLGESYEGADGREALNIVRSRRVDLILSDLNMPGMDGAALVKALNAEQQQAGIPVVLITTEGRPEVLEPLLKHGVKGYIKKPFRPEAIKAMLGRIMGEASVHHAQDLAGCDF
ncbi:MAG: response regulator [Deltaproteobacteria bacterium]|nr:response regulator [Deltaproteobacteria bacterium]